jgi:hypothetical protein
LWENYGVHEEREENVAHIVRMVSGINHLRQIEGDLKASQLRQIEAILKGTLLNLITLILSEHPVHP